MKTEIVTLSFDVKLDYMNDAGREWLIKALKRDARVDMGGGGAHTGAYGMRSIEGTAEVKPKPVGDLNYEKQKAKA